MNPSRVHAMDHVVLVLFENRSFDNLLGRLYAPGEVDAFEGVIGKELYNPVPEWAEHRQYRGKGHVIEAVEAEGDTDKEGYLDVPSRVREALYT